MDQHLISEYKFCPLCCSEYRQAYHPAGAQERRLHHIGPQFPQPTKVVDNQHIWGAFGI